MNKQNYYSNINKLALIGAILALMGDFIDLLITYQEYRYGLNNMRGNNFSLDYAKDDFPER
ncbi:MAG: hypothetical protein ACOYIG_03535 [Acetivibrionales bacterium]|jgi:hypothetical protein|nr:hypothetical protein [Clostridiaceae bacterium]